MKKKITTALILIVSLSSVFAASNMIGSNVGLKIGSSKLAENIKLSQTYLDLEVAGTSMLGKEEKMGIAYGFAIEKLLSASINGSALPSESLKNYSLNAGGFAQFVYRLPLADKFNLDLAAGLGVKHIEQGDKQTGQVSTTTFNLQADVKAIYLVTKNIALSASVGLDCPLYKAEDVYLSGQIVSGESKFAFDFFMTAKVGVAYAF